MADEEKSLEQLAGEGKEEERVKDERQEEQSPEMTDEQYNTIQEEKAIQTGWQNYEKWVDGGGDPKDWVKADVHNVRRGLVRELRKQKKTIADFDSRLIVNNQMHQAQMDVQRKELTAKRDAAALEGGEEGLENMKNAQHQLDTLNQPIVTSTNTTPELDEWNARNPWINEETPKAAWAISMYSQAINSGYTVGQAIAHAEAKVAESYPNPARSKPVQSEAEGGSKPTGFKKSENKLTMADITPQEQKMLDALPAAWEGKSDTEILKHIADSRK